MAQLILFVAFVLSFAGLIFSFMMLFRNNDVADFFRRMLHEEAEWLEEHPEFFTRGGGKFLRYESLPKYTTALYKFWIPLESYEKPIYDFYRDLPPVR